VDPGKVQWGPPENPVGRSKAFEPDLLAAAVRPMQAELGLREEATLRKALPQRIEAIG
jgi:hypothetical protein